jgi:predicted site-specific integrase-resolvase
LSKLLTVKNLCDLFQRDEETIRRWIKDGDVFPNAFKVKDGWYVPVGDVKKLMKKNSDRDDTDETRQTRSPRGSSGFVNGWK